MEQERGRTKVEEDKREREARTKEEERSVGGLVGLYNEREVKCKRVLERRGRRGFWRKRGDGGDGENIRG